MIYQLLQIRLFQGFQHIHLTTRQQRRNHLKRGVFRRRPYQRHRPLLDGSQQGVLLSLGETVDFINKENRIRRIEKRWLSAF